MVHKSLFLVLYLLFHVGYTASQQFTCDQSKMQVIKLNIFNNMNPGIAHLVKDVTLDTEDMFCVEGVVQRPIHIIIQQLELIKEKNEVKKVYCLINGDKSTGKMNRVFISNITNFPFLEELWLASSDLQNIEIQKEKFFIYYSPVKKLPLKRLHIDSLFLDMSYGQFYEFVTACEGLEVFHTTNTGALWQCGSYSSPNIFWALQGKPLRTLVLKNSQEMSCDIDVRLLFEPLKGSPVEYLDLSRNELQFISHGFIEIFPNLKFIDLSYNRFLSSNHLPFLFDVFFHPSLIVLYGSFQNVENKKFSYATVPVVGHKHQRRSIYPDCKEHLINTTAIDTGHKIMCEYTSCMNTSTPCEMLPEITLDFSCVYNIRIPVGRNLEEIYLGAWVFDANFGNKPDIHDQGNLCFTKKNKIKKVSARRDSLFLKRNDFQGMSTKVWLGLQSLTEFDIGNNQMDLVNISHALSKTKSLKTLIMDGNNITFTQNVSICHILPSLEVLNVSNGQITHFPINIIRGCKYLKEISLSHNIIEHIHLDLAGCNSLEKLDFRYTNVKQISELTRKGLDDIAMLHDIELDLTGQTLSCHCDHLETIHWLQHTSVNVKQKCDLICVDPNGRFETNPLCTFDAREILLNHCKNLDIIISVITTAILTLLILMVVLFFYKYRFHIKTKIQRMRRRLYRHMPDGVTEEEYDAYVHYAGNDRHFVHKSLLSELEDKNNFKFVIRFRDHQLGQSVPDLIVESIQSSRTSIIVLSKDTFKNEWMEYSINLALEMEATKSKKIIWIKLSDIPLEEQPLCIRPILSNPKAYDVRVYPDLKVKEISLFYERVILDLYDVPKYSFCYLMWSTIWKK